MVIRNGPSHLSSCGPRAALWLSTLLHHSLTVFDRWSGPGLQPADPLVAHQPESLVPLTNSLNQRFTSSSEGCPQP